MTIREAIIALERLAQKHGDTTDLYFDCPHCRIAFTPDLVVTQELKPAIVVKGRPR